MTRDEIIRMAREAGGSESDPSDLLTAEILERFAALIAAQRDADKANQPYSYDGLVMFPPGTLAELIRRERAKEREACREIAFRMAHSDEDAVDVSHAIRARGEV
jgi:hypothetical protein